MQQNENHKPNNFELQYSPRTTFCLKIEEIEDIYSELKDNFDPITIKMLKRHFKERLGELTKEVFVAILKNHLFGFLPNHPKREEIITTLLNRLFSEIDLNDNGSLEWNEFTNYMEEMTHTKQDKENNMDYILKFYNQSNDLVNINNIKNLILFAFYVESLDSIGIVQEGSNIIEFYDTINWTKEKFNINLKLTDKLLSKILEQNLLKKIEDKFILEKKKLQEFQNNKKNSNNNGSHSLIPTSVNITNNQNQIPNNKSEDKANIDNQNKAKKGVQNNNNINNKININNLNKKIGVLCICMIEELKLILISCSNNTISAWMIKDHEIVNVNVTHNFEINKHNMKIALLITDTPQQAMSWDSLDKNLYTGDYNGKIYKWTLTQSNPFLDDTLDISTVPKKENNNNINKKNESEKRKLLQLLYLRTVKHKNNPNIFLKIKNNEEISNTYLLMITKLHLLAAAYSNGTIILWDVVLKEPRKHYYDQNTPIHSLVFDDSKNLLFSCGYSHDIYVYDPYIDSNSIYILKGHNWSINSIDINEYESEIFSIDSLGVIKIWDSSSLEPFQTIKLNEDQKDDNDQKKNISDSMMKGKLTSNIRMLYIKKYKKIFIYGTKVLLYETDNNIHPELSDDQLMCACYFNPIEKTILCFCLRKIKIWKLLTGKVKHVYNDPMGDEITAVAVDLNVKRGFIGDNSGNIKNINLKTGYLIKDMTSHSCEIKLIVHNMATNLVASCSVDNVIKIHNDEELKETEVIKELEEDTYNVNAICIIDRFKRLAIGLSSGIVKFYDIDHLHYDSDLISEVTKDAVTALAHLKDNDLIFVGYNSGKCGFKITPPSPEKFTNLYTFINYPYEIDTKKLNDLYDYIKMLINESDIELEISDELCNIIAAQKEDNSKNDIKKYNELCDYINETKEKKEKSIILNDLYNYINKNDIDKYINEGVSVTCVEFDLENHYMFIGDFNGQVSCYDIKEINDLTEDIKNECEDDEEDKYENEPIISKKTIDRYKQVKIYKVWSNKMHSRVIRHIHFINIIPSLIITTSKDLTLKIFNAEDGEYYDQFCQYANRYKPFPVSIKYYFENPFEKDNNSEIKYKVLKREELEKKEAKKNDKYFKFDAKKYIEEIVNNKAEDILRNATLNCNAQKNQSNNWKVVVDVDKIKEEQEEDYNLLCKDVKEIEEVTANAEKIFETESFYSMNYKPEFILQMDDKEELEDISKNVNEKLKIISLAKSKAKNNLKGKKKLNGPSVSSSNINNLKNLEVIPEKDEKVSSNNDNIINDNSYRSKSVQRINLFPLLKNKNEDGINSISNSKPNLIFPKINNQINNCKIYDTKINDFKNVLNKENLGSNDSIRNGIPRTTKNNNILFEKKIPNDKVDLFLRIKKMKDFCNKNEFSAVNNQFIKPSKFVPKFGSKTPSRFILNSSSVSARFAKLNYDYQDNLNEIVCGFKKMINHSKSQSMYKIKKDSINDNESFLNEKSDKYDEFLNKIDGLSKDF